MARNQRAKTQDKQTVDRFLKESRESEILLRFTEELVCIDQCEHALVGILLTAITNNPIFDSLGGSSLVGSF